MVREFIAHISGDTKGLEKAVAQSNGMLQKLSDNQVLIELQYDGNIKQFNKIFQDLIKQHPELTIQLQYDVNKKILDDKMKELSAMEALKLDVDAGNVNKRIEGMVSDIKKAFDEGIESEDELFVRVRELYKYVNTAKALNISVSEGSLNQVVEISEYFDKIVDFVTSNRAKKIQLFKLDGSLDKTISKTRTEVEDIGEALTSLQEQGASPSRGGGISKQLDDELTIIKEDIRELQERMDNLSGEKFEEVADQVANLRDRLTEVLVLMGGKANNALLKDIEEFLTGGTAGGNKKIQYWEDVVANFDKLDERTKSVLRTLGLISDSGGLKAITDGANNYGGLIGDENTVIVRKKENTTIDNVRRLKEALDEAADAGVQCSRIVGFIETANGDIIELQKTIKGDMLATSGDETTGYFDIFSPKALKASAEQIQKFYHDIKKLMDLGLEPDIVNPSNIIYDEEKGFQFLDISFKGEEITFEKVWSEFLTNMQGNIADYQADGQIEIADMMRGFAEKLGQCTVEGFRQGIDAHSNSKEAERAVDDFANGVVDEFEKRNDDMAQAARKAGDAVAESFSERLKDGMDELDEVLPNKEVTSGVADRSKYTYTEDDVDRIYDRHANDMLAAQHDIDDLQEELDDAEADKRELQRENAELRRQLSESKPLSPIEQFYKEYGTPSRAMDLGYTADDVLRMLGGRFADMDVDEVRDHEAKLNLEFFKELLKYAELTDDELTVVKSAMVEIEQYGEGGKFRNLAGDELTANQIVGDRLKLIDQIFQKEHEISEQELENAQLTLKYESERDADKKTSSLDQMDQLGKLEEVAQAEGEVRQASNAVSTEVERQNEKLGEQKSLYDQIFERVEKIRILGAVGRPKEDLTAYGEGKYGFESPDIETYRMQMDSLKTLTPSGKSNADIRDLVFDPSKTIEEVTKELVRAAENYQTCKQSLDEMFSKAGIVGGKLYDDAYRMLDNASLSSEDMADVVSDTRAKLGILQQENTIREESRKNKEAEAKAQAELNEQKSAEPTPSETPVLFQEQAGEAIVESQEKAQEAIGETNTLLRDLGELLSNLSANNLRAFDEAHGGILGISDDNLDEKLKKLKDIKQIITKLTRKDPSMGDDKLLQMGIDDKSYESIASKIPLLEKLGYAVSEIREGGAGYEADIIPIPDKAITNAEDMLGILFDIKEQSQDLAPSTQPSTSGLEQEERKLDDVKESAEKAAEAKEGFADANATVLQSIIESIKGLGDESSAFKSLNDLLKMLGNSKDDKIQRIADNIQKIRDAFNGSVDDNSFINALKEIASQGENLKDLAEALKASKKQIENAKKANQPKDNSGYFDVIKKQIDDIKFVTNKGGFTDEIETQLEDIRKEFEAIQKQSIISDDDVKKIGEITERYKALKKEMTLSTNKTANTKKIQSLLGDVNDILTSNTTRKFRTSNLFKELQQLQKQLQSFDASRPKNELDELSEQVLKTIADVKGLDNSFKGKGFMDRFANRLTDMNTKFLAQYFSWHDMLRYARTMISTITDLDTQLVDLRKTTTMNNSELERFYKNSSNVAKQLGVTTSEIIQQASSWSRLGYSSNEAATEMAKLSSQFASISPGMDVTQATDGLVSTMKAFGYETDEVLDSIMSKINIIGNTAATSNQEIVDMLTRSSASMAEANNTLEETIALETAAVEITRSAETTGTMYKTKLCLCV